VVRSPLHAVIDFSGCGLLRRLCVILLYFSLRVKKDRAIIGAVVGCAAMVHAI
jgi:hypothetical protein